MQGNYSIFKDVNGDGYVLSSDGLLVLGRLGNSLPAAKPVATRVPGGRPIRRGQFQVFAVAALPKLRPLDVALISVAQQLENGGLRTPLLDSPAGSSPVALRARGDGVGPRANKPRRKHLDVHNLPNLTTDH